MGTTKYVVVLTDNFGGKESETTLLVEAGDRAKAVAVACSAASHAEQVALTRVEVHGLFYPDFLTEAVPDGHV